MKLEHVTRFSVNKAVVQATEAQLRAAGREGFECFVLWSGIVVGDRFMVMTPHVPLQSSYKTEDGLCVRVMGDELHKLNRWLFDNSQILGIQIHTHPHEAYHSETDSTYPIVTTLGGLSIVLPNFCATGMDDAGVAIYRLGSSGWTLLSPRNAGDLLEITN